MAHDPTMRWSKLNSAQRAFLMNGARWSKDVVKNGKVIRRGEPMNAKAEAVDACKALDRDFEIAKRRAAEKSMKDALAAFTPEELSKLATKLPAGSAYGSRELNRKRSGAMPMNFYRQAGMSI